MIRCSLLLSLLFMLNPMISEAQELIKGDISFQQLDSLQKQERRPVMVLIQVSWCRYCHALKQTTLQDEKVQELLGKHFYFVKLDAEEKKDIVFRQHRFRYQPTGPESGQHELAHELGLIGGKLSLPTLCFLSPDFIIIYQLAGYLGAEELRELLIIIIKTEYLADQK